MERWKAKVFSGWFLGSLLFVGVVGAYYVKCEMGIDLLKDRHLLIFSQEPQWERSFEPSGSERRTAQESNKVRRGNFHETNIYINHG